MRQSRETKYITIEGEVERSTLKAVLLRLPDDRTVWVPKSQINNAFNDRTKSFDIAEWFVDKEDLGQSASDDQPLTDNDDRQGDSYDRFRDEERHSARRYDRDDIPF